MGVHRMQNRWWVSDDVNGMMSGWANGDFCVRRLWASSIVVLLSELLKLIVLNASNKGGGRGCPTSSGCTTCLLGLFSRPSAVGSKYWRTGCPCEVFAVGDWGLSDGGDD